MLKNRAWHAVAAVKQLEPNKKQQLTKAMQVLADSYCTLGALSAQQPHTQHRVFLLYARSSSLHALPTAHAGL